MKLLFRLLRQNINVWQLFGFTLANLLGAIIVLVGIQAYYDVDHVLEQDDTFMSGSYLVISKPVKASGSLLGSVLGRATKTGFSDLEIADLKALPDVTAVGAFTSAHFTVMGALDIMGMHLESEMFLESVPDSFLDVSAEGWEADVDGDFIPVILPRAYLNLYNYGFASGRGLPQVGEGVIQSFPFQLHLSGNGLSHQYKGRVVAFSNRLNTILVPDKFLSDANARFGNEAKATRPQRLIVNARSDQEGSLLNFLEQRRYITEGQSAENLRMQSLVHGIIGAVVALGLVVSLLAFYLLMISILLLIEKNRDKFSNLYALGYSASLIAQPYQCLVLVLNVVVWSLAGVFAVMIYGHFNHLLALIQPEYQPHAAGVAWLFALHLCILFMALHMVVIYRATRRACS